MPEQSVVQDEPQGDPAVPAVPEVALAASPVGTTQDQAAVQVDPAVHPLQQALDASRAETERWKTEADKRSGYEKVFTKSNQTGALELAKHLLPDGSSIEDATAHVQGVKDALELQTAVEAMGGMDKLRDAYDILYGEEDAAAAATPGAPQPAPAAAPADYVSRGELERVVSEAVVTAEGKRDIAVAMSEVSGAIARDAGLATDDKPVAPETLELIHGALDRAIARRTPGGRSPDVEDIAAAGNEVLTQLIVPLRASGAVLPANQAQTPMPPTMNAGGAGGQLPAKPISQMTEEEQRARAMEVARQTLEGIGLPAQPQAPPTDPYHRFR